MEKNKPKHNVRKKSRSDFRAGILNFYGLLLFIAYIHLKLFEAQNQYYI